MSRRTASSTAAAREQDGVDPGTTEPVPAPATAAAAAGSLADLPVAGLTRRRIALLIGALVAAWVIVLFARQVGEASEAASKADEMRAANAALVAEVSALQGEYNLVQRQDYIQQQAREYRLGAPREIPFVLADDAPPLSPDAPGMAGVRLGAVSDARTPLESWLDLLFGDEGAAAR